MWWIHFCFWLVDVESLYLIRKLFQLMFFYVLFSYPELDVHNIQISKIDNKLLSRQEDAPKTSEFKSILEKDLIISICGALFFLEPYMCLLLYHKPGTLYHSFLLQSIIWHWTYQGTRRKVLMVLYSFIDEKIASNAIDYNMKNKQKS